MSVYLKGLLGEQKASSYLKKQGVRILEKRFRYGAGEIDLIGMDGKTLCFVEVKYRPEGMIGSGIAAVGADKRKRVRSAAAGYVRLHSEYCEFPIRCDILEIAAAGVTWLKNVF